MAKKKKARQGPLASLPMVSKTCLRLLKELSFPRNSFSWTNAGTGAAVYAFFRINPAFPVFFDNRANRTFAVTGAAVHTGISDFIGHSVPL